MSADFWKVGKCFTSLQPHSHFQLWGFTCKCTHTQNGICTQEFIMEFLNKLHTDKLSAGKTMEANKQNPISSNPYPELEKLLHFPLRNKSHSCQTCSIHPSVPPTYCETNQSKMSVFTLQHPRVHIPRASTTLSEMKQYILCTLLAKTPAMNWI